jgi:hypothetical protein
MNQYLLLRDNKQTGPYTAEELAAKGLKAYDLVWLEGKSAAWRYPSEIAELKAFAPVVEEQPYDRFYKKPAEQSATQSQTVAAASTQTMAQTTMASSQQLVTEQQPAAATSHAVTAAEEQAPVSKPAEQTTARHIYVTMPESKPHTVNTTTPVTKKEEPKPVPQQATQTSYSTNSTQQKKAAASSYIISQEDDELNSGMLKGFQSRKKEDDEINTGYLSDYEARKAAFEGKKPGKAATKPVEKVVTEKNDSWHSSSSSSKKDSIDFKALLAGSGRYLQDNKNVTRTLVAAVLILGGVVIGLVINSGRRQPDNSQVLESLVKEIREQQNGKSAAAATEPATETSQKNNRRNEEAGNYENSNNNNTEPASPSPGSRTGNQPDQSVLRPAVIKKDNNNNISGQNKPPVAVPASNIGNEPVEPSQAVVVESKTISQELIEKARKNIYDQVRIEASAFKVGLLGGISDLDITVLNSSLYTLDQVSVEVKYFGPEKKLVKTQTLVFNNIPAGKRRTLEAPRTNRGISIDYSVVSINSKVLGLAQASY